MAKSSGQKLKLLYLIKMLQENTDENHPMSTPDIIKYLENQGIHAERKSIYSDMESLADFGYDVVQVQSRLGGGYYLGSREFELQRSDPEAGADRREKRCRQATASGLCCRQDQDGE